VDDLVGGLFIVAAAVAAAFIYACVAGAAAAALAVAFAFDSVGYAIWRIAVITRRAIATRGGDRRAPSPPEPAYEIYFGRPLIRDFWGGLGVIAPELLANAEARTRSAFGRFKGYAMPLAFGVAIGAYVGAAIGLVVGGVVATVIGFFVVLMGGAVWLGSRSLLVLERTRRRLRGAHFDCPSCHERSPLPVYVCPECGARHHRLLPGKWGVRHRRCECDAMILPTLESTGRHALPAECPKCQLPMPGASGIVREVAVPIVGGPRAGKTAYLASLLVELGGRSQTGSSRLAVVEASRAAFESLTQALGAGRVPAKTQINDRTPAFVAEVRSGVKRSALLYAHDIAGELYQEADRVRDTPYLERAAGAILLVDPFSLRPVARELERERADDAPAIAASSENPQNVLERLLHALRESGRKDVGKLPLAVVLSKTDALPEIDGVEPGARGDSVRRWLDENGAGNLVRMVESEFATSEFFAVSALGRIPDPSESAAFVPQGTLEPFLWLLAANGVELDGESAETRETVTESLEVGNSARVVTPFPRDPLYAPGSYPLGARVGAVSVVAAAVLGVGGIAAALVNAGADTGTTAFGNASYDGDSGGSGYTVDNGGGTGDPGGDGSSGSTDTGGDGSSGSTDAGGTDQGPPPYSAPSRVLKAHFERIDRGDYTAAFGLMSHTYRDNNPNWASARAEADPGIAGLHVARHADYQGGSAYVHLSFYARDRDRVSNSDTQCRHFSGDVEMIRSGGTWRYNPHASDLSADVASDDNSACP
jgi:hypothetical protein